MAAVNASGLGSRRSCLISDAALILANWVFFSRVWALAAVSKRRDIGDWTVDQAIDALVAAVVGQAQGVVVRLPRSARGRRPLGLRLREGPVADGAQDGAHERSLGVFGGYAGAV
jgi:hypothetical protein